MENSMGNEGINKLATVFQDRMRQMGERPQTLDFGVIQGDMSLLLNGFPKPIPPQDYLVCRQLTLGAAGEEYCETTSDGHHAHNHQGIIPEKMRSIRPGDRVLVAWVGEDDACVIDIILPGTAI